MDVFNKKKITTRSLLFERLVPFMDQINYCHFADGVLKLLKGLIALKLKNLALKESATELGAVIAHLCQQTLDMGKISRQLFLAYIRFLYKKGDIACTYRPVSLASLLCKLHKVCTNIIVRRDEHELVRREAWI